MTCYYRNYFHQYNNFTPQNSFMNMFKEVIIKHYSLKQKCSYQLQDIRIPRQRISYGIHFNCALCLHEPQIFFTCFCIQTSSKQKQPKLRAKQEEAAGRNVESFIIPKKVRQAKDTAGI